MKNHSVVLAGYYGFNNAGDELILSSMIAHLRTQSPGVEITVLSAHPEQTARRFSVNAVDRWHPWEWLAPLWRSRRFILGGGGLLQESSGSLNHAYYLFLALLAKSFGCRTEVSAIGVDPIRHALNRWWTCFVFNWLIDSASVRDIDSQRVLESAGVRLRLSRSPDWTFRLQLPPVTPVPDGPPLKMAFAVGPWRGRPGWEHDLAFLMDRIAVQLKPELDLLVFFPDQDDALAQKVSELTTTKVRVRRWTNPEELLAWIQEYQLVIGMRYHALALAALAEKAFIGWGYERKVRTICRDFGQPVWTFERGWEPEAVFRQICESWRQRDIQPDRYRPRLAHWKSAIPVRSDPVRVYPSLSR